MPSVRCSPFQAGSSLEARSVGWILNSIAIKRDADSRASPLSNPANCISLSLVYIGSSSESLDQDKLASAYRL